MHGPVRYTPCPRIMCVVLHMLSCQGLSQQACTILHCLSRSAVVSRVAATRMQHTSFPFQKRLACWCRIYKPQAVVVSRVIATKNPPHFTSCQCEKVLTRSFTRVWHAAAGFTGHRLLFQTTSRLCGGGIMGSLWAPCLSPCLPMATSSSHKGCMR